MAIKSIKDPIKGSYDVFVSDGVAAAGTIVSGSTSVVGGVLSASVGTGGQVFVLSGAATSVLLPAITTANIGTSFRIMTDVSSSIITGSNPLSASSAPWTQVLAAFSTLSYQAVSGTNGFYWHL